jgi:hypothetical protein
MKYLAFLIMMALSGSAYALDCDAPPYGMTMRDYDTFISINNTTVLEDHRPLILEPDHLLGGICRAKNAPGKDRTFLIAIGITEQQIAKLDVYDLTEQYLRLTPAYVNKHYKIEDGQLKPKEESKH